MKSSKQSRIKSQRHNAYEPWSPQDDSKLLELVAIMDKKDVCVEMKRTRGAVDSRLRFLKKPNLKEALDELFEQVKHGDQEHQKWLRNKFDEFLKNYHQ